MSPSAVDGSANSADADDAAAAEAEAARAEERAKAARARAAELRRKADELAPSGVPATAAEAEPAVADHRRTLSLRHLTLGLAALLFCAILGVIAAMSWTHHVAQTQRQRAADAAAVARQGVIDLMSLNFINADEDMQRVMDNATGKFKEEFQGQQYTLVKQLEKSKVVTHVDVTAVATESASADSAVVLVAATSQATNLTNARQPPKRFRVVVTLAKDQGRLKISQVAFV
ncbi:hypothetical protein [Mycobacterium sp. OTB74]|uniref:hypothetical protein n=1 Tax=Mycobacterium sp. OTB74 TaxID=1853452 RepID=UPI002476D624|nr:hypothetical protein [Mycobacterium sp. OTB74]MDH6245341.1 Mce-associated membrane protein [Mycobacterium sp. OTB74]